MQSAITMQYYVPTKEQLLFWSVRLVSAIFKTIKVVVRVPLKMVKHV
jgi:hypothetical protein